MEYTVQKLGKLAGISTRTLRYYDEIDLLKPARVSSSGYRIYGTKEVDRLQVILFYRELGMSLDEIKRIVRDPLFDRKQALIEHRMRLVDQRRQLDQLISNVENTIAFSEGRITMTDKDKFVGFKQQMVHENEQKYGEEIREKYGDEAIDQANQKVMDMTPEEHARVTQLADEIKAALAQAMQTGDPASDLAQKAAALHKQWLMFYWNEYSKEAHAGLAQMYVDDERFKAHYDQQQEGTAEFLRDAIHLFTGVKK
ncbi:MerR family transcriptional regulator [Marininema halotolerans]|uniref:DNA-binding transcriptional regulator, MerR family n=1 Tax=Marininema halotolerans TaxID=1155944 RepID=A0A1I6SSX1_9BACL|nr:MerR family transcriptional regulator [Marininema halotolerans]SFS80030.1 DNA-binding transcriptional regulator, MerR family [Marininema halotolerans]